MIGGEDLVIWEEKTRIDVMGLDILICQRILELVYTSDFEIKNDDKGEYILQITTVIPKYRNPPEEHKSKIRDKKILEIISPSFFFDYKVNLFNFSIEPMKSFKNYGLEPKEIGEFITSIIALWEDNRDELEWFTDKYNGDLYFGYYERLKNNAKELIEESIIQGIIE